MTAILFSRFGIWALLFKELLKIASLRALNVAYKPFALSCRKWDTSPYINTGKTEQRLD